VLWLWCIGHRNIKANKNVYKISNIQHNFKDFVNIFIGLYSIFFSWLDKKYNTTNKILATVTVTSRLKTGFQELEELPREKKELESRGSNSNQHTTTHTHTTRSHAPTARTALIPTHSL
jgi:hypothetical protein